MKKLLKGALSGILLFSLAGCSKGSATQATASSSLSGDSNSPGKLAYTVQSLDNEYFVTISNGVKDYAESLGMEVTITNGNQDVATQVSQIENFIEQGVDYIIISPVSDTGLEDVVKKATDSGIVVVAANQNVGNSQAFVTIPEYDLGRALGDAAGKYIAQTWGDAPVDVLVLDYPDIESIVPRGDGMRDGITENAPNANIVQSISANTTEKGSAAMETALQKFPNIQVVIGCNDAAALGAYEVFMAQNKATDKSFVGGMDGTEQALNLIKEGTIYKATIDINAKGTGKILVDTALKVKKDGPINDVISIPLNVVTAENVSEFLQ